MTAPPPVARRLVLLARTPAEPSPCLLLDARGDILARRALLPGTPPDPLAPATVVAVPGEHVRTLWLDVPLRNPEQARAAARVQLDGELAADAACHLALGAPEADGARIVAVVDQAVMQAWVDQAAALGLATAALLPDHLLLPLNTDPAPWAGTLDARIVVRGPRLAFTAEPALAEAVLADLPPAPVADAEPTLELIARGALQPALDLRQGGFAVRGATTGTARRRLRVLAALLVASPLLLTAAGALRHELSARRLQHDAVRLAAAVADPAQARTDPLRAVEGRLDSLRGRAGFHGLARALLDAVGAHPSIHIEQLHYVDGRLQALLAGAAPDGVQQALQAAGLQVAVQAVEDGTDGPRSRIDLEPGP